MNSIDAYESDIQMQPELLRSFKKQKVIPTRYQKDTVFAGSGDSLVSALLAEVFSGGIVRSADQLVLYENKNLTQDKHVYFVSISGNTITNIRAAKKTNVITSKLQSRLAKATDGIISLNHQSSDILTAGSIPTPQSDIVTGIKIEYTPKMILSLEQFLLIRKLQVNFVPMDEHGVC